VAINAADSETGGMSQRKPIQASQPPYTGAIDPAGRGRSRAAHRWTYEEDAFIRREYQTMTNAAIARALGRSKASVLRRRANSLQLGKKAASSTWTTEDDAVFRALYGEVDTGFLAGMLSRPISALWAHAFCLKVKSRSIWSHDEDEVLRTHFPRAPVSEFAELLPGRSKKNIYYRAEALTLARDPLYLLGPWRMKFHGYPPELRELIRLHNQVERKLQDVQAQHRKPAGPPVQSARKPR
jgi:hypothetical protein